MWAHRRPMKWFFSFYLFNTILGKIIARKIITQETKLDVYFGEEENGGSSGDGVLPNSLRNKCQK